ncbi:MAG: DUF4428 domain-containing protein [Erysipelotrichaceae bacterium]|nr:DUF4428 domain-containing protein [Erysipelotrichaceae bacterium]
MEKILLRENGLQENCSVCGNKLTRFGSKVLKDGMLCRNCAKLASEWLEDADFAEMTVEQIREHLAYRQENREKLAEFKGSKVVDGKYSLFIDDESKDFLISKRSDYVQDNADLLNINEIRKVRIVERKYLNKDGSDVCVQLLLRHPQFSSLKFQVNEFGCLNRDSEEYQQALKQAYEYVNALKERK